MAQARKNVLELGCSVSMQDLKGLEIKTEKRTGFHADFGFSDDDDDDDHDDHDDEEEAELFKQRFERNLAAATENLVSATTVQR
ncbi:hypothetical protein HDV00_006620 [Rhizophlyctis rosea]|nr:hypothetical protein HDV00_006620 [Rhizophlyctis rosea]